MSQPGGTMVPLTHHGSTVNTRWAHHRWRVHECVRGVPMASPWGLHGDSMACPWCLHAVSIVPPWWLRRTTLSPWCVHGVPMLGSRCIQGVTMTCSWCLHGVPMMRPLHSGSMVGLRGPTAYPWRLHGTSMVRMGGSWCIQDVTSALS